MSMFVRVFIRSVLILLISNTVIMSAQATDRVITQTTKIDGIAVASACQVKIDNGYNKTNQVAFDIYDKSNAMEVSARPFTLWLYEEGSSIPGCSAFMVSSRATVSFGNPGQLDELGVVTRGAGNGVRIDIRALDEQADYRGKISLNSKDINYPSEFASSGKFVYSAKPVNLERAVAGEYRGTLTFVVTYQ